MSDCNNNHIRIENGKHNKVKCSSYCEIENGKYNSIMSSAHCDINNSCHNDVCTSKFVNIEGDKNIIKMSCESYVSGNKNSVTQSAITYLNGSNNTPHNSTSTYLSGSDNNIKCSSNSFINGTTNCLQSSTNVFVSGTNCISHCTTNSNISGSSSSVSNSGLCGICSGLANNISNSQGSVIPGGIYNNISGSSIVPFGAPSIGPSSVIPNNFIPMIGSLPTNVVSVGNSIAGGIYNNMVGTTICDSIGGGLINIIGESICTNIGGGLINIAANSICSNIGGGLINIIGLDSNLGIADNIGGGIFNIIGGGGTIANNVGGGIYNIIDESGCSNISGGYNNIISSTDIVVDSVTTSIPSLASAIGGGFDNSIYGITGAFLAGIGNYVSNALSPNGVCSVGYYNMEGSVYPAGSYNINTSSGSTLGNISYSDVAKRLFMVGNGNDDNNRSNAFSVDTLGNAFVQKALYIGGADYAEYFESESKDKYLYGSTVVLMDSGKIRLAVEGDIPFGVVSTTCSIIGNTKDDFWQGKYQLDEWGNYIFVEEMYEEDEVEYTTVSTTSTYLEESTKDGKKIYVQKKENVEGEVPVTEKVEVYDENNKLLYTKEEPKLHKVTKTRLVKKISDNYDPSKTYIPRSQRPEWNVIGLLGVVRVLDGQVVSPNWTHLSHMSTQSGYTNYFIKP